MAGHGALCLALLCAALAACSSPRAHVHASPSGDVSTSASSGVGPVRVGLNSSGHGYVGTKLGWLGLSAGF
ncbi:hypothetical protein [Rhodobacter maris]|uniref:Uncharacterized protein n=1 Tax=Rhodobacter maris TaxID=446682 RepID=A0A285RK67_9RHOB|nr:hypothetical protein [Rhodobacter maris]SOB94500.1 hypothetical protein SAMN05877831_101481 [Rhodobacter maris]